MGRSDRVANSEKPGGKKLLEGISFTYSTLSRWGLSHYDWKADTTALEIGCKNGANVRLMLELAPEGHITGVDATEEYLEKSIRLNQKEAGSRCEILKASEEALPFGADTYDLVIAFDAIYYWKNLSRVFKEVQRVLKPGGMFIVNCEVSDPNVLWTKMEKEIRVYSAEELRRFFVQYGFCEVKMERKKNAWVCVTGKKPLQMPQL